MKNGNPFEIDWDNIDLNDGCESNLHLIDGLTFSDLLTEIDSNLPDINEKTVREQFELDLRNRVSEARDIFNSNLKNIVAHANKLRNNP